MGHRQRWNNVCLAHQPSTLAISTTVMGDALRLHKAIGCHWSLGPSVSHHHVCSNFSIRAFSRRKIFLIPSNILPPIIFLCIFSRNYRTSTLSKIKTKLLLYTVDKKEINQSQWYGLNILFQCLF